MKDIGTKKWESLRTMLTQTGLLGKLAERKYIDIIAEVKEKLNGKIEGVNRTLSYDEILYLAHFKAARLACIDDFNWFMRVAGKPDKILKMHEVKERFLKEGPSALPASYRKAEAYGAIFQWVENPSITLILYPRGFGKSTNEANGRPLHEFVKRPDKRALILHGDKLKVNTLLRGIGLMMQSPKLSMLWPEFFSTDKDIIKKAGTRIVAEKIDIKINPDFAKLPTFNADDFLRREATFTTGSPEIDRTGMHFERVFFDDLVGEKNSRKKLMQEALCSYFDSLFGMEEYSDEPMSFHGVGTRWRGPGLYQHIIDNHRSTVFQLPLTWDDDASITYSYHRHRIADFVTNEFIDKKKADLKEWFDSQMYMKEVPYEDDVSFDVSPNIVFAFKDDEGELSNRLDMTREDFVNTAAIIISKDPSYSTINKTKQTASLDTTITVGALHGVFYVFDEYQQKGGNITEEDGASLYAPVRHQLERNNGDFYVQDCFSYQTILFKFISEKIRSDFDRQIVCKRFGKSAAGNASKEERARIVLTELFQQGKIKVHQSCVKTLAQVARSNIGFDIIDALVQVCATPAENYEWVVSKTKLEKNIAKTTNKGYRKERTVLFETTGY